MKFVTALLNYPFSVLWKMQQRAALWISGIFWTLPTAEIEAISGHISIHLYLKKLYSRFLLRGSSFPSNHIISSILSSDILYKHSPHNISINNLTPKQRLCLKFPFIDIDDRHNKLFSSFSFFDKEFNLGNCLVNSFSDRFSFHLCSSNIKKHIKDLDNLIFKASSNPSSSIIVSNTGIKNHIIMSISHNHLYDKPIIKMIHKAVNITTTEAKLFATWYGINQAVVIIDFFHTAKKIFNSLLHLYQI